MFFNVLSDRRRCRPKQTTGGECSIPLLSCFGGNDSTLCAYLIHSSLLFMFVGRLDQLRTLSPFGHGHAAHFSHSVFRLLFLRDQSIVCVRERRAIEAVCSLNSILAQPHQKFNLNPSLFRALCVSRILVHSPSLPCLLFRHLLDIFSTDNMAPDLRHTILWPLGSLPIH